MPDPANPLAASRAWILDTEPGTAVPMSTAGLPREIEGQPVEYRRKEICRAGRTVFDVAGDPFEITRERLDKWVNNFARSAEAGARVFIPTRHTEIISADNRGFVVALSREGDSLMATEQLIGADAMKDIARNDQSVYIKRNFTDDRGNHFDELLQHVALTPAPQVTGLSGYAKVAASRGPDTVAEILTPASNNRSPTMDTLKTIREQLGAPENYPDDQLPELMTAKLKAARDAGEIAGTTSAKAQADATHAAALSALKTERDAAVAASRAPTVDENTAILLSDSFSTKKHAAVASGGVDPATAEEIDKLLKSGDRPNSIALSRLDGSQRPLASRLWDVLAGNKPRKLGEKTGRQAAVALDNLPVDDDADEKAAVAATVTAGNSWRDQQLAARGMK